jgi:hypothetical protein
MTLGFADPDFLADPYPALARLEMRAAPAPLVARWPRLTLAAEPVRRPTFVLRAFHEVRLSASTRPDRSG